MKRHPILMAMLALVVGLLVGWRATILNLSIHIDNSDPNIAIISVWGQSDWYTID